MKHAHENPSAKPGRFPTWIYQLGWSVLLAGVGLVGLTLGAWLALGHSPWRP